MSERIARFSEQLVASVRAFVDRAKKDLRQDMVELEARLKEALPKTEELRGAPGQDAVIDESLLQAAAARAVAALPRAKDGEPGRDAVIDFAALQAAAEQAVAKMPRPQDGKSISREDVRAMLQEMVDAIPRPADGKSVDPAVVRSMVDEAVAARVAQLPPAQPGKDGKDAAPETVKAMVDAAVAALPKAEPGRDGRDVDMGEVRALLETLFKGIPTPRDGKDVDAAEVQRLVEGIAQSALPALVNQAFAAAEKGLAAQAAALVPIVPGTKGEDGENGKDGQDGLSIEDFDIELRQGRTLVVKIRGGDRVIERELKLAGLPIYKGTYETGRHEEGDLRTYGGSVWRASRDTTEPPRGPSNDWQLVVKGTK